MRSRRGGRRWPGFWVVLGLLCAAQGWFPAEAAGTRCHGTGGEIGPTDPAGAAVGEAVRMVRRPGVTVRFLREGIEVVPRRGGGPWLWRLAAFCAGDQPLDGPILGPVEPRESAPGTIDYPRGPIVERYVLGDDGIEQRFLLLSPLPLGGADLVVEGIVESVGRFEPLAQGWRWGTGAGAVRLGDVRVADAGGRPLPGRLEVTPSSTRLTVDSIALSAARYPVTIDPEIGVDDFRISDMGPEGDWRYFGGEPRAAYNPLRDQYLVVWNGLDDFAHGGDEIYGQLIDAATGEEIGVNDFRISDMGPEGSNFFNARDPEVAYNAVDDEYLVVWFSDDTRDGDLEVYGQRIDGATGEEVGENDFRMSDTGPDGDITYQVFHPHLAYNSIESEYLVVWEAATEVPFEREIHGQRLDGATGAEIGEDDFRISSMGPPGDTAFDAENPAVTFNPTRNEYLVVWSGDHVVDGELEIWGQRLDGSTGAEIGRDDFRVSQIEGESRNPSVAWNPDRDEYLVVFDAVKPEVDPNREIYGQRLSGATVAETGEDDFRISEMGPEGDDTDNLNGGRPQAAYSAAAGEYLVVWSGQDEPAPLDGEAEVWGQRLDGATGAQVGANDFRISSMGPDGDARFDGGLAGLAHDPGRDEFLVVWGGDDRVDEEAEVYGQLYAPGLFEDDFEDEEIAGAWSLPRGAWSEDLGVLAGVPEAEGLPAGGLATGFAGCTQCTVTAELAARDLTGPPEASLVWLAAWAEGLATNIVVALRPELDRVLFAQRRDGTILAGGSAPAAIEPDVFYRLEVRYDGARFVVSLDGEVLFDEPSAFPGEPFGTVGFGARGAEVEVEGVWVVEGAGGGLRRPAR